MNLPGLRMILYFILGLFKLPSSYLKRSINFVRFFVCFSLGVSFLQSIIIHPSGRGKKTRRKLFCLNLHQNPFSRNLGRPYCQRVIALFSSKYHHFGCNNDKVLLNPRFASFFFVGEKSMKLYQHWTFCSRVFWSWLTFFFPAGCLLICLNLYYDAPFFLGPTPPTSPSAAKGTWPPLGLHTVPLPSTNYLFCLCNQESIDVGVFSSAYICRSYPNFPMLCFSSVFSVLLCVKG